MSIKSIIIIISAVAIGSIGFWIFSNPESQQLQTTDSRSQVVVDTQNQSEVDDMPVAEDFLSLQPTLKTLPYEPLSEVETAGLLYTREEEKLARDVYLTLYDTWNLQIFSNIAQSEQTHTESVRDLLEKYDIADPVTDDTIGMFANDELQQLYDKLVERGNTSLEEALAVGAFIEDLDIYDLQQEISKTNNQDITLVYENLMRGSRNHMRSFISQLTQRGKNYTPQYITQAEFDTIIAADQERGSGHSRGNENRGGGQGQLIQ